MNTTKLAQTIQTMKQEIEADIKAGRVPETVKTFSELHDYVDANCYGEGCEETIEGCDDQAVQSNVDFLNAAQNAVDAWLRSGRK